MALRDDVYNRAEGRCECFARDCGHTGRCLGVLRGKWDIHRIEAGGPFTLANLVALCEACDRHVRGTAVGPLPGF
jgi:hypothetical protein